MKFGNIIVILILTALPLTGRAQSPREIFAANRPKICRVQFYKNVSSQAQIGSYIKIRQHRIGVIVSADGLVMVNSDVYPLSLDILSGDGASFFSGEPSNFTVILSDGSEYPAEFVGKDDQVQVAFVRLTDPPQTPLPYVSFVPGDSVQVGDPVYLLEILGESYQFEPLFTSYVINAVIRHPRRKFLIKNGETALSAGGLVLNAAGGAIGVTLRSMAAGEGFHESMEFEDYGKSYLEIAPSEWLTPLIAAPPALEKSIYRGKSWFGVGMQALTADLKTYWKVPAAGGVVIDRVYPDSPAEHAGLKIGDVIIAVDDKPLEIQRDEELGRFRELITRQPPGKTLSLKFFRDGKIREKKITLAPAPRAIDLAEKYQLSELGLEVRRLTRDILYDYNLPLDAKGVYVFQVDRAAPAGLGGLEAGSIITAVNGQPIANLSDFQEKMARVLADKPAKLMFQTRFRRVNQFVFVDLQ